MDKRTSPYVPLVLVLVTTACAAVPSPGPPSVTPVLTTPTLAPTLTSTPNPTDQPGPTPSPEPPTQPAFTPVFEPTTCRFEVPHWLEGECGTVTVLEDRSRPEGNRVEIPLVIFRSTNPEPEPDPVIYLTGGGGGNELDNIERYSSVIVSVIRDRDYIMYNQRGAKYSRPYLQCEGWSDLYLEIAERGLSGPEAGQLELDFLQACSQALRAKGYDLNQYNSAVNAADLNDLRLALGYDQINIYGTSYGTRMALAVLRDCPEMIRSAIIDSVYPPQVDFFSEYATNAFHAFTRVFEACAADDNCHGKYPQLEAELLQVVEGLNAKPNTIPYNGHTLYYNGDVFLDAIYYFPYSHYASHLPLAIHAASQGDTSYAEGLIPFALDVVPGDTIALGVQNSMLCREEAPFESDERSAELLHSIPDLYAPLHQVDQAWRVCEAWGVDPADPVVNQAVYSEVPTLVLEGYFDPITPIEWGRLAAETLSNSFYYEFPGGHGIMRTYDCGRNIGLQFIDDPWMEPDASCIEHMSPPDFQ